MGRGRRGPGRVAAAAVLCSFGLGAPGAGAATGDLTFAGCLQSGGAQGCIGVGAGVLDGAVAVAVSPAGDSVYVVSQKANAIVHLRRAASGVLTPAGCFASSAEHGCNNAGRNVLDIASGVALSPQGDSVYAVAFGGQSLVMFQRAANGDLTTTGCFASGGAHACRPIGSGLLDEAAGVAVSPGGDSVYVTSQAANAILHFRRAANGDLTPAGCLSSDGSHGCTSVGPGVLDGAAAVAVSPGGDSVYVASFAANAIVHLRRATNGDLTFAQCFASGGAHGCADAGAGVLDRAAGVAVSPQGDSVYTTSAGGNAIAIFGRAPNGNLSTAGCFASGGAHGCRNAGAGVLDDPAGVAVSPQGDSVYVVAPSSTANSLVSFRRATSGDLTLAGCAASGGANGCTNPGAGVLDGASGVALSPLGDSVYVASFVSDSIAGFRRELPVAAISNLSITPGAFAARQAGPSLVAARKTGAIVSFQLDRPGAVRFTVERRTSGRRVGGRCVAQTKSNRGKPRCTRYRKLAGNFTDNGAAGTNRFRFTGRIAGKRLAVGSYRLVATPFSGNSTGVLLRAGFRITG